MNNVASHLPSRRTVARGAAWTAPAIAIGLAAPSAAASTGTGATPPGLQGWVQLTKDCSFRGMQLTIDGVGNYPDRGLWVYNTTPATQLSGASMTFYLPSDLHLTWHATKASTGWSTPVTGTAPHTIGGMTAYTMTYSGPWVHVDGEPAYTYAVGQPQFTATSTNYDYCTIEKITSYAYRTISVDGEEIHFQRGPISL